VVIDEAIEIGKTYGTAKTLFINGVLGNHQK
jgi:transcription termination factor NusB